MEPLPALKNATNKPGVPAKPAPKVQHEQDFINSLRKLYFSCILCIYFLGKDGNSFYCAQKTTQKSHQTIQFY